MNFITVVDLMCKILSQLVELIVKVENNGIEAEMTIDQSINSAGSLSEQIFHQDDKFVSEIVIPAVEFCSGVVDGSAVDEQLARWPPAEFILCESFLSI